MPEEYTTDYLGRTRKKTPEEILMEAMKIKEMGEILMTGQPKTATGVLPLQATGYAPQPVSSPPPTPTSQVPFYRQPPAPPPIQPPTPPPIQPPQRGGGNFLTSIGKGLKRGIHELGTAMKLGPEGYERFNLYKEMLPYEKTQAQEQFGKQFELEKAKAGLKPKITLDQQIDNLRNYLYAISYEEKEVGIPTGRRIPYDVNKYNSALNQLEGLMVQNLQSGNNVLGKGITTMTPDEENSIRQTLLAEGGSPDDIEAVLRQMKSPKK